MMDVCRICEHCLAAWLLMSSFISINLAVVPKKYPSYENEVIKIPDALVTHRNATEERVTPNLLEAYYYRLYGDLENTNAGYGRNGDPTSTWSCEFVRGVPLHQHMKPHISHEYTKYTEAYGIPVLGTPDVPDRALSRACYVLRFMLSDSAIIRERFYANYGRLAIIPETATVGDLPEYRRNSLPPQYDIATRGLGAVRVAPLTSVGVENLLCYSNDVNRREDILVRTMAHSIQHLAAKYVIPDFHGSLTTMYERARKSSWWDSTYASHTPDSYFGQGVQAYFNVAGYASPANGVYNSINTRVKLRSYDPELYYFIQTLFPCGNTYLKRCTTRGNENFQTLQMDCPQFYWESSVRK